MKTSEEMGGRVATRRLRLYRLEEEKKRVRQVLRYAMVRELEVVKTYCQSFLMWPFCRSLLRKAT